MNEGVRELQPAASNWQPVLERKWMELCNGPHGRDSLVPLQSADLVGACQSIASHHPGGSHGAGGKPGILRVPGPLAVARQAIVATMGDLMKACGPAMMPSALRIVAISCSVTMDEVTQYGNLVQEARRSKLPIPSFEQEDYTRSALQLLSVAARLAKQESVAMARHAGQRSASDSAPMRFVRAVD